MDKASTSFQSYRAKSIAAFFGSGVSLTFSSGEVVINGLNEPDGVFFIKSGFVKACSTSDDGHANLLIIHSVGEFIPLPWALNGYHVTGLFYEAMTDVVVLKSSKDGLRNAMGNNLWLTQDITNQLVNIVAIYTQRIQILQFRSARGKVIAEMLYFAQRFGKADGDGICIYAPLTHQDVADSINMTRETASRALELLFEEGLVGQKGRLFTIPNVAKLEAALI
jgi:CRP-like cAMP-binding protein